MTTRSIYILIGIFTFGALAFYIAVLRHLNTLIEKIMEAQRRIDEQIKSASR